MSPAYDPGTLTTIEPVHEPAVIVLGGGPAGSAAARLLSLWGHRVLLLTRSSTRPPFAESLPPSCRKLLDPLGVTSAMDAAGFVRTTGNTVWWGEIEVRRHEFGGGEQGYQVRRDVLDGVLLKSARDAGVHVWPDAVVRGAGDTEVRFEIDGRTHVRHAAWVVDATGQTGLVARRGWRRSAPGPRTLALVAAWERPGGWGLEDESHTLVESYEAGWAWSVPVSDTVRHFAVMVDPARTNIAGRDHLDAAYRNEVARTRQVRRLLESAVPRAGPWATDASAYDSHRYARDGILLVGDAASFIDPLSSYGVKKALASAWLAAVVVNTCIADAALTGEALAFFESRERAMYESLTRQAAELAREAGAAHDHPFWRDRAAPGGPGEGSEPDIAALRGDADVLAAFQAIREAPSLRLREGENLRRVERAVVRENRIVLMPHIAGPAFPEGIRYLRGVELPLLVELAQRFDQVPDMYEAYHREAAPVALPDFLGALSVIVGKRLMERA